MLVEGEDSYDKCSWNEDEESNVETWLHKKVGEGYNAIIDGESLACKSILQVP